MAQNLKNNVTNVKARIAADKLKAELKAEKAQARIAKKGPLSPMDVIGRKIVESVRVARNAALIGPKLFKTSQKKDAKVVEASFVNEKKTQVTIRSVQKVGAKIPSYELAVRSGEKVQIFKGQYARESWNVANKELKGRKTKVVLSETEVKELDSWF